MAHTKRTRLDHGWLFGGPIEAPGTEDRLRPEAVAHAADPGLDDSSWKQVTLPHVVVPLSWRSWVPAAWERVWAYRRRLDLRHRPGTRLVLEFGAAMTNAVVSLDGVVIGEHHGGYLPFRFDITDAVAEGRAGVLAVAVDARFNVNVPPNLPPPAPTASIDFLQPGGLHRSVSVLEVPEHHVAEVAISHHDVLVPERRRTEAVVELGRPAPEAAELVVTLVTAAGAALSRTRQQVAPGDVSATLSLDSLAEVELWDVDHPVLYQLRTELVVDGETVHSTSARTGLREARFELDGFYLNGRRRYLFGVNRHAYFPFAGFALSDRAHRRDAEIIKRELNCTMVRCAHYPQTESFLDACDELGLLVWEESPGWQYVGDDLWQQRALTDIQDMIARDRHRPSIVVWGARLNETPDRPDFYARTEALVKGLDPTRQTSGTMCGDYSRQQTFQHDVFAYDDYHTEIGPDGLRRPVLLEPVPDRPYLVSEALSTRSSPTTFYRRVDDAKVQQQQALDYAHAHDIAMGDERFTGLLAWAAFDYQANMGNHYRGIKTSGLGDVFRELKPGAAIYRAQVDPALRPVLEPAFTWDPPEFGQRGAFAGRPEALCWGPGDRAVLCTNLDRVEVYLGERHVGTARPDRERYPNLPHPPALVDLRLGAGDGQDLRLEGYLCEDNVLTRHYSADRTLDVLQLVADDIELVADGSDATRVAVRVVDRHGNPRSTTHALVELEVSGPASIVGDQILDLAETGAVAACWIRSRPGEQGAVLVRAAAAGFGAEVVTIKVTAPTAG